MQIQAHLATQNVKTTVSEMEGSMLDIDFTFCQIYICVALFSFITAVNKDKQLFHACSNVRFSTSNLIMF